MNKNITSLLVIGRVLIGWLFLYAGITKIINPNWSAAGYIKGAKTFSGFYEFLLQPNVLPIVNFLNEWGLTLIGAALILGIFVRYAGVLGAILMLLYYFPILNFPYVGDHSYLVDEHIIYAVFLLILAGMNAGRHLGVDKFLRRG